MARSRAMIFPSVTGWQPEIAAGAKETSRIRSGFTVSLGKVVNLLVHIVGRLDDLRIRFVGTLAGDQVDELIDDADVRLLNVALEQCSKAVSAAGRSYNGGAGSICGQIKALPDRVQTSGILEVGQGNLACSLGGGLAGKYVAHRSVVGDVNRLGRRRYGDLRLNLIAAGI